MHRFFAPGLDPGDEYVDLPRDEAEHLTRVLRLGPGDTVAVFDGHGHEYFARIVAASRRDARVQVLAPRPAAPESTVHMTLVQAVLKGDKMDDVVRDAVMLGAAAVQPVVAKRSDVTVAAVLRGSRVERWRRVALASAKQCGRAVLPEVRMPLTLDSWLGDPPATARLMLVEPRSDVIVSRMSELRSDRAPDSVALLVGPEGGWEKAECDLAASHGVRLVSFSGRTLRADAVAIAALAVLQFVWDGSG
jgi:16S rRNA (uracil1498-N3)-methyltransferase